MASVYNMSTFTGEYAKEDSVKVKFKNFLKEFYVGNYDYKYRDQLKDHFNLGQYWIEVNLEELNAYDEILLDKLQKQPGKLLEVFEEAATEVCDEVTRPRKEGFEDVPNMQVMLTSIGYPTPLRELNADMVSKLITVSGIIVTASQTKFKATSLALQCTGCRDRVNVRVKRGLDGYNLPRKCSNQQDQTNAKLSRCPLDPYHIIPRKCEGVRFQTLKLQESPENIPRGCMPRHLRLYCDRMLCDKFTPGNRVTLFGTYSIVKIGSKASGARQRAESDINVGLRNCYLNVLGYKIQTTGPGHASSIPYTAEEEEEFRLLASSKDCYEKIVKSIAPAIFGFGDVKKALAALLFSGSVKHLPDGTRRRGDINVLLLGDPGTAKSQVLKFAEQVAPIGVYTSGKGSSAAGLTASVIRDNSTRNFSVEGGAMVLADGGVVCVDEFDKMREDDRVAIHEAMEQQTISIAKAGITVTLNSRCSVLAAANSVHGKWDDYRTDEENIEFMPTILSRFDMIFVIKDRPSREADIEKARHILGIHSAPQGGGDIQKEGELTLDFLKKYIAYARSKVGPRISPAAAAKLVDTYVEMRNGPALAAADRMDVEETAEQKHEKKSTIPITVRQFEALIRISESLAKMELKPHVEEKHIREALRLFDASTLAAAKKGELAGAEGFVTEGDRAAVATIEKTIKRRLSYGLLLNEAALLTEFENKGHSAHFVKMALMNLVKMNVLSRKGVQRGKLVCIMK